MRLRAFLALCINSISLVRSAVLSVRETSELVGNLDNDQAAKIFNFADLTLNASSDVQCSEAMGCMQALSLIPRNGQLVTFGQSRLLGHVDYVMPYVLLS
ncbi:MAG: hypothetical protein Q9188_007570, partial [Gyalolechia gomerana]